MKPNYSIKKIKTFTIIILLFVLFQDVFAQTNVALNKTVSEIIGSNTYNASAITDGNFTTSYNCGGGYILIDLGKYHSITSIKVSWTTSPSYATNYTITTSPDNINYNSYGSLITNTDNTPDIFSLAQGNVRYIKMTINSFYTVITQMPLMIAEIEVFGNVIADSYFNNLYLNNNLTSVGNITATGSVISKSSLIAYGPGLDGSTNTYQLLSLSANTTSKNYLDLAKDASNIKMPFYIKWRGDAIAASALTIDGTGYVGIGNGITSPYAPLHIRKTNAGAYAEGINLDINDATTNSAIGIDFNTSTVDLGSIPGARIQAIRMGSGAFTDLTFSTRNSSTPNVLNEVMRIANNGNVGIGTTSTSTYKLNVAGNTLISGPSSTSLLVVNGSTNNGTSHSGIQITSNNTSVGYFWYDSQQAALFIGPSSTSNSISFKNNAVGIGTLPRSNYLLDVAGYIRADQVVVNSTGADFVFENNYKLRSLKEVETYVKENKHLPDIATAKDMQENGVSVSEMQTKLLQKVEEITIYMIELKKENEELKSEIEKLKNK
jgi:hypothetical protein